MRASAFPGAVRAIAMLAGLCALLPAARTQEIHIAAPGTDHAKAAPPPAVADDAQAQPPKPLTPDESAVLEQALLFDSAGLANAKPAKPLRVPGLSKPQGLDVKRSDKPDGSSTVVVKQPLTSEWDAKVGADLIFAAPPPNTYQPDKPLPGARADDRGSGAAWASVGVVPNLATVDARVDPTNDQGKLAATFKHSVPVGDDLSVTLQDRYSVTETFSQPTTAPGSSGLPPRAATPAPQGPSQVWGSEKSVKLNIQPTGTMFGAGFVTASNDPVTHNTLSAEQKLLSSLHVRAAVTDVDQPTSNKSITAGFKLTW